MPRYNLNPGASNSGGPATSGGTWTPYGSTTSPVLTDLTGQRYFIYDKLGTYQYQYSVSSSCGTFSSIYEYVISSLNTALVTRPSNEPCTVCLDSSNNIAKVVHSSTGVIVPVNVIVTAQPGLSNTPTVPTTSSYGGISIRSSLPSNPLIGSIANATYSTSGTTIDIKPSVFNVGSSTSSYINVGTNTSGNFTVSAWFSPHPNTAGCGSQTSFFTLPWIKTSSGASSITDNTATTDSGTYQSGTFGPKSHLSPNHGATIAAGLINTIKYTAAGGTFNLGAGTAVSTITAAAPNTTCVVQFGNTPLSATTSPALVSGVTSTSINTNNVPRRANWSTINAGSTLPGTYEITYGTTSNVCGTSSNTALITNSSKAIKQFPIKLGLSLVGNTTYVSMDLIQVLPTNPNLSAIKALTPFSGITWSTIGCILAIPISASLLKDSTVNVNYTDVEVSSLMLSNGSNFFPIPSGNYATGQLFAHKPTAGALVGRYSIDGLTLYGEYISGTSYSECALYILLPKSSTNFPTVSGNKTIAGMGCSLGFKIGTERIPAMVTPNTFSTSPITCPEQTF